MTNKLFAFAITLCICTFSYGQESEPEPQNNFQIGLTSGFFLTGELDATHNFTIGVQGRYFISHKKRFHHFASAGFTRDLNSEGANLTAIDLGLGTQYDLFYFGKRPLYLTAQVGALYYNEQFSIELINDTVTSSFDEFGFKANLGFGYHISKRLSVEIGLTQYHTNGTTVGLQFSYSF